MTSIQEAEMAKTPKPRLKPGEIVKDSGIYRATKSKRRATMVKGEPAPPTPQPGEIWVQIVDTNPDN